jgi:predicted dienelactone hydrolase
MIPTPHPTPSRRRFCSALLAAAAAAAAPRLRAEEAAYTVHDLDWADAARARAVPVRLYLPRTAAAGRPVPLVVFSHGIGGSRFGYRWLGTHWAGAGVASLHLQHVGSDRSLWTGNPFALVGRLHDAATDAEALARVHDLRFALDALAASAFAPLVDATRIVAAGHSYGANTTLLAVERDGRRLALGDERVRAAIAISAPPFYGEREPARILAGVTVPSLHVTATDDVIRIPGYFSGADDRVAVFEATGSARKWLAVFEGGAHSMFTDRSGPGGPALNAQVKAATKELTSGFVAAVFDGDARALADWPQRHAAIVARFQAQS